MLSDKRANCVEYSTAIASFCIKYSLPCEFLAVGFDPGKPEMITHVFCLVENLPFDLVLGQEPPDKNFVMNLGQTKKPVYIYRHKVV
jgi:hypothetical protein